MAMTKEDQGMHEIGLLLENQSWGFSNFENSGKSKEMLAIEIVDQEEEKEGEPLMSKKQSQENVGGSDKKVINAKEKDGKSPKLDLGMHMQIERERRKKISNLFATLHALLPQLPSKANKSTIVDEAVNYIESLKQILEKLKRQKLERLQSVSTLRSEPSVINSLCYPIDSNETFIADHGSFSNYTNSVVGNPNPSNSTIISVPRQPQTFQTWSSPNLVLNICEKEAQFCIFATRKLGLLTAIAFVLEKYKIDVISANIMCNADGNRYMILASANRTTHQLILESTSVEEIYMQAAREIMQWIS